MNLFNNHKSGQELQIKEAIVNFGLKELYYEQIVNHSSHFTGMPVMQE